MRNLSELRAGFIGGVSLIGLLATPAFAQTAPAATATAQAGTAAATGIEEIVVTAQRTAQSLQDVPIAISAFSAQALEKQQINNAADLQLSLPNITFTKSNFTGASFTIRGIGDLCVGTTCDSATGIATNDLPLFGTRLFETEFFDLERVEVLRGPQGTLFGRNATSGVINFITAKPDLSGIHAAAEGDYGNFNSVRVKGMLNVPLTDTLAVRVAGTYLRRDGYTKNLYTNSAIDNRDLYSLRGSLRWKPSDDTTIDLMAYYFHEKDNRSRIQKQLCDRDPTGILGCLPGQLTNGVTNGNATLASILTSKEFLTSQGGAFGGSLSLGSLYGTDVFANSKNPADVRTVNTAFKPNYSTSEQQYMGKIGHNFGSIKAQLSGLYQSSRLTSQVDYNINAQSTNAAFLTGLATLAGTSVVVPQFKPIVNALFPSGPNGPYCTSLPDPAGVGAFGGKSICGAVPLSLDQSDYKTRAWTLEGIVESSFDGPFNFLLGGIYTDSKTQDNNYYVNSFALDYATAVLGTLTSLGSGGTLPNSFLGTPFYDNNTKLYTLKSYGIFGEAYYELNDKIKVTAGIRYNNDKKFVSARTTLASFLVPYGSTDAYASPFIAAYDADPFTPGNQLFANNQVSFGEFTGRAVIDWKITNENLVYASYSRGYKSGGINPPLSLGSGVSQSFDPEFVNSFEIGSKNTFLDGTLRANLTAFYYQYKGLQLSRIVQRTSVNDNVSANIYGLEGEFIIQPTKALAVNFSASYLHTRVSQDKFLTNAADPSGGRSDAVIIKDITNASNCAVIPNTPGNAALTNGFVTTVNNIINAGGIPGLKPGAGLAGPVAFPAGHGINGATGAYSVCAALTGVAAATQTPVTVISSGVPVNIRGNQLPQAPEFKFSAGIQYTAEFNNGLSLVPRFDLALTGQSFGSIFNTPVNRVQGYYVMNAQVQLNGRDDRWFLRGYIQNISNNNATTGLYVTDQSSGLFTNIFTLEPRRYGVAAGFKF